MNKPSFRRAVLWITGRDLLKPKPQKPQPPLTETSSTIYFLEAYESIVGRDNWILYLGTDNLQIHTMHGPNFIHRAAQQFAFGIRWKMTGNVK